MVWSDNFNDGNYDGWTICDNAALAAQFPSAGFNESQWSAADNHLKLDQEDMGIITHPSNVANGTWSFDIKLNETLIDSTTEFQFAFIADDLILTTDDFDLTQRYCINLNVLSAAETMALSLRKRLSGEFTVIDTYGTYVPVTGWHSINITRTEAGLMSVYLNDTHIMQVMDTDIDTCELVWLWFEDGTMIDNIVVNDEVLITHTTPTPTETTPTTTTTTPTTPPPPFDWLPIAIIGASAVVIVAVLVFVLRRR
jgi:hypothetical protein